MTDTPVSDRIAEKNPDSELLQMDGFDDCIIGTCDRFGQETILAYDYNKVIDKIMTEHECDYPDACDHFGFNIIGAWVGDSTPCFIDRDGEIND